MAAMEAANPIALFNREVERNWLRTRNGLRFAAGGRFAQTGRSPKDVMLKARKAELWRYRPLVPPRYRTPVLLFIGLVSRSYVIDLVPGNSFVEEMLRAGYDVWVLDWGVADEADAENTLATYVHEILPRAIRAVLRGSGSADLNMLAYCMGGCFAVSLLATRPTASVRSLVSMATPINFDGLSEFYGPLRTPDFDVNKAIDETGNLSAGMVHGTVRIRRPTGELVQYANLWQNLWNEDFMEGFQSMREWVAEHIPFPGGVFREVQRSWLVENGFVNGTARVGGERVDLSSITCPTMSIVAGHDEMVPDAASAALPRLLTGTHVQVERVKAGHVSLVCGRGMRRKTIPTILRWLSAHSDAASRARDFLEAANG